MINFQPLILDDTGSGSGSFIDIFTSNVAIIVYIIIFALAIIAIAILFIVNESLTNEKISKIEGGDPLMNAMRGQPVPTEAIKAPETKQNKKESGERFQKLIRLDKQYQKKEYVTSTEDLTLEYLCRRFRSFASRIAGNPLY